MPGSLDKPLLAIGGGGGGRATSAGDAVVGYRRNVAMLALA